MQQKSRFPLFIALFFTAAGSFSPVLAEAASEAPTFKMMCREVFFPAGEEYHKMKYNETIWTASGNGQASAVRSKMNLTSNSSFNYLIRRSYADVNPTLEMHSKGIRVRNPTTGGQVGWGNIEQTWSHLHENIAPLTQALYESNMDKFQGDEHVMIQRIITAMHMKQDIKFISEKSKPGFFSQTGPERLAVTGSVPGSTIYINDAHTQIFSLSNSQDILKNETALGDPSQIRLTGTVKSPEHILNTTKEEVMANIFGLLVHEFGHHVGYKDTADRPLDQLAAKFEQLAKNAMQEVDLAALNQPWIRMRTFNPAAPTEHSAEGKFYFVDSSDIYDLSSEMKSRVSEKLGKKFSKIWTYNLRIEGPGSFDSSEFATPISFIADVVAFAPETGFVTVPVRLVAHIGPSQAVRWLEVGENWWQFTNGQMRKTSEHGMLSMEVLTDRQSVGMNLKPNPKLDITSTGFTKKEYAAGDIAEFYLEIPAEQNVDSKKITAELTGDNFVQSGPIRKTTFTLSPTRLMKLANGNTVASFEWQIPPNVRRSLNMKISRISASGSGSGETVTFRLASPLSFKVNGLASAAKLLNYGNEGRRVVGTIKAFPAPWLQFSTEGGTAIPLEYQFQGGNPISVKISGSAVLKGERYSENSGFVIDVMAKENHPLIESKQIVKNGDIVSVRIMLRIPKVYNNLRVDHLMLKSVYFLDEKLDEAFGNAVIGIQSR